MENTISSPVTLRSTDDQYIVSIDKKAVDVKLLLEFLERLRLEHLIDKAGFDESIEEIGEKINQDWWAKNKEWFLNPDR